MVWKKFLSNKKLQTERETEGEENRTSQRESPTTSLLRTTTFLYTRHLHLLFPAFLHREYIQKTQLQKRSSRATERVNQREKKNGLWEHVLHSTRNLLGSSDHIQHNHLSQCPAQARAAGPITIFFFFVEDRRGPRNQDAGRQIGKRQWAPFEEEVVPHGGHGLGFCVQHMAVQGDVLLVQEIQGRTQFRHGWVYQDLALWEA